MNYNCKNTKDNTLCVTEDDGLVFDYEEIRAGIERAREDTRCGRYADIDTCLERIRKKFAIE